MVGGSEDEALLVRRRETRVLNNILTTTLFRCVLDDVLDHDNRVHVHPMVNNGLTARGMVKVRMTGVEVCGSFQ